MASAHDLSELEQDPRLFLFTSLTAGSSHIITATSRMETILKANKIPFQALDTATDEKARRLWQRRAGQRKLPGLVKDGLVIGDLTEVEEWNEFGELKENIGPVPASNAAPAGGRVGVQTAPPLSHNTSPSPASSSSAPANKKPEPSFDKSRGIALPGAAEIAARNKAQSATKVEASNAEPHISSPEEKKSSVEAVKDIKSSHPAIDHLSAPASRIQSGTATPAQVEEAPSSEEKQKHRGSDIIVADAEQVKEIEKSNLLQEDPNEDAEDTDAVKGVADLKVDDEKPTQEQAAKEPEDASKTVAD
ncbi:uncharacterized protein MYCFIDRAFT_75171 [Pseudocercospora fijiensis CIRAD86]|uniref:Uncharacterized protein n=1 Tax=Pseudocercospora fijiensis (strain CIRAD86) TaxID=383855 RepID=N1Q8R1_PSEFD|nr:uncharacterized protein MYCFIDRAFT_75171 [Pseudocercospora fijiensis CIRAD86]EME87317.1 hypothetical protein MYCFIDRAFT_75171 [Pseudocercospora fijiensis CIRAD86]